MMVQLRRRWIPFAVFLIFVVVASTLLHSGNNSGVASVNAGDATKQTKMSAGKAGDGVSSLQDTDIAPSATDAFSQSGPVRYILMTTQRTGSTMMCTLIDRVPSSSCLDESVLVYRKAKQEVDDSPLDWAEYEKMLNVVLNPFQGAPPADAPRYVRTFVSRLQGLSSQWRTGNTNVVGFKLMYNQMFDDDDRLFSYLQANNVRIIHLIRQSALDSYASIVAARQSGVFHSQQAGNSQTGVNDVQVDANVNELLFQLNIRDAELERVRTQVRARSMPYMEVFYEDVAGEHTMRDVTAILRFLSLPSDEQSARQAITHAASHRKPVATLPCKERFRNWKEVRTKLIEAGREDDVRICEEMVHPELGAF